MNIVLSEYLIHAILMELVYETGILSNHKTQHPLSGEV